MNFAVMHPTNAIRNAFPCSDSTVNKYSVQSEIFVIYV